MTIKIQDQYLSELSKIDFTTREGQEQNRDLRRITLYRLVYQSDMTQEQAKQALNDADDMFFLNHPYLLDPLN